MRSIFRAIAKWWSASWTSHETETVEDWEARQF